MNRRAGSGFFLRVLCKPLLLIIWALWFGGVMGLFLSAEVLFRQTDRAVFLASAPQLFLAFERYQLVLAATALLTVFTWRMIEPTSRLTTLFALFAIATIGAVVEITLITPRLETLRLEEATQTPQFMRLHGLSMCVYMAVETTLLIAGIIQSLRLAGEPARCVQSSETASRLAG